MKTHLIILFLIPKLLLAQLSYDSLANNYKYNCNCFENLIVQGNPIKMKYHSRQKEVSIFQVEIDTVFYNSDLNPTHSNSVLILSKTAATSKLITESNLFVLRRCSYCDAKNQVNCRPLLYYEIVHAARNESRTIEITRRHPSLGPCVQCQAIRPYKRKHKSYNIEDLDDVEKFIDKKRGKIRR
jgi:hypothetical protein